MPSKETFSDILALPHISEIVMSLIQISTAEVANSLLEKIRLCISESTSNLDTHTEHEPWYEVMDIAKRHGIPLKLIDYLLSSTRDSIAFALKISLEIEMIQWLESIKRITDFFQEHILADRYKYLSAHPEVLSMLEYFTDKLQQALCTYKKEIFTVEKLLRTLLKKEANALPPFLLKKYYEQLGQVAPEPECIQQSFQKVPNIEVFQNFAELFFMMHYELRDVMQLNKAHLDEDTITYIQEVSSFAEMHGEKFVQQRNVLMTLYAKM